MAAGDGLISMTPTSIAHSGTSASINADGGVDFTAVTSLSLNGVFTSDYDNYLIVVAASIASVASPEGLRFRLRATGVDASGSDYTLQSLNVDSTTVSGSRVTTTLMAIAQLDDPIAVNGSFVHIYGPAIAQPTAVRSVTQTSTGSAAIFDRACTHGLSTAYDGFTVDVASSNITGNVHVFGYEE